MANASPAAPTVPVAPATPAAPVAPAKPATPPIPVAQESSRPKSSTPPPAPAPLAAKPDTSLKENLKKLASEVFNGPEAKEALAKAKPVEATEIVSPASSKKAEPVPTAVPSGEKKPEAPVATVRDRFSDIAPPDGATEVTQKGWKALKDKANAEIASAEQRLFEATAQLDTFRKATPAEQADTAKLQADLKAAHDRLSILDVSATPEFANQYIEPKKKALAEASQLIADNAIEGAPEMTSLLALPRHEFAKKVSELAKTMPAFDQGTFVTDMREAYRLEGESKTALSKAGELHQQLQAQTAQRQKAAFEDTFKEVSERLKPLEVPDGADDAEKQSVASYNEGLAGLRAEAEKNAFGRLDDRGVARLAAKAATLDFVAHNTIPRMQARHESAVKLISEMTAELAAIKAAKATPSFSGDAAPAQTDTRTGTFADSMREAKRAHATGQA